MKSTIMFSAALAVSTLLAHSVYAAADTKIGVVDVPKAIQATKEGQRIKKQLEEEYNKRKADLEKKVKEITAMQAEYDKKSLVWSEDARSKKQQEIEAEKAKYMELREKNMQDLAKRDRELSEPMIKKLNEAIKKVASTGGYSIILHKNDQNLVWASQDSDVTDQVIKALEK